MKKTFKDLCAVRATNPNLEAPRMTNFPANAVGFFQQYPDLKIRLKTNLNDIISDAAAIGWFAAKVPLRDRTTKQDLAVAMATARATAINPETMWQGLMKAQCSMLQQ